MNVYVLGVYWPCAMSITHVDLTNVGESLQQPIIFYLKPGTGITKTVTVKRLGTNTTSDSYELHSSDGLFCNAIYINLSTKIDVKVGDTNDVSAVSTIGGDKPSYGLTSNLIFDVVHVWADGKLVDITRGGVSTRWSPLAIDGETPHTLDVVEPPEFSRIYQRPVAYLKRLGLPSTRPASIAVAMYAAAYVRAVADGVLDTVARMHMAVAYERIDRLLRRASLRPTKNHTLLPPNLESMATVEMKLLGDQTAGGENGPNRSPWSYCADMLTALPMWTRLKTETNSWNAREWNEIGMHLGLLCARKVSAPVPTSALPYACVQFYPNRALKELMERLTVQSPPPPTPMDYSTTRLTTMMVKNEEVERRVKEVERRGAPNVVGAFGSDASTINVPEDVNPMLWRMRKIWHKDMNTLPIIADAHWNLPKDLTPTSVYLVPFGCWMTPMVNMNNPSFAQFPISTTLFKQNMTARVSKNTDGNATVSLQSVGSALLIYETTTKTSTRVWAVGATKPTTVNDEYVRAMIFNIDRLVQLFLLIGVKKTANASLQATLPIDTLTNYGEVEVFAITILQQILKKYEFERLVDIVEYPDQPWFSTSIREQLQKLPDNASVPLGELVLASTSSAASTAAKNKPTSVAFFHEPVLKVPPAIQHTVAVPIGESSLASDDFTQYAYNEDVGDYEVGDACSGYRSEYRSEFSVDPWNQILPSRAVSPPIPIPTSTPDHP